MCNIHSFKLDLNNGIKKFSTLVHMAVVCLLENIQFQ